MLSSQAGVMGGIGGQLEGLDIRRSAFAIGQGAGAIHDVKPAGEIVREIMAEAEDHPANQQSRKLCCACTIEL